MHTGKLGYNNWNYNAFKEGIKKEFLILNGQFSRETFSVIANNVQIKQNWSVLNMFDVSTFNGLEQRFSTFFCSRTPKRGNKNWCTPQEVFY